ncbi:bifunctional DNA primase/polymerase [Vibrio coralliilyticus]|uniref:Integrase n=1 Tax=Vibrio coralliilyticus TaxID=190893 RepID=A0AAP6ZVG8_9VIBR|nr:bifunctional DNA primase/polymerase [Vibrio coralliilyticus]NOJ26338.1 integrase [Vibrio coralliilyticus]
MFTDKKIKPIDFDALKKAGEAATQEDRIHLAARVYIKAGYLVVPLHPRKKGGKSLPLKEMKVGYGQASRNKDTIDRWFGIGGKFRGFNIGLACGTWGGIFVIDVDVADKHGNRGFDALSMLEEQHGKLPETQIQNSPSGGRHYIFQWADGGRKTESTLAAAIDTRGGDDKACRSHIVAYPSIRTDSDEGYCMVPTTDAPAEVPSWVLEDLKHKGKSKSNNTQGRGSEEVDEQDVEAKYKPSQIRRMLDYIDPDDLDYEEWLICIQAVHSQFPDEIGFKIADEWSQRGARYEAGEIHSRWTGFDETGEIRVGSLIHFAQQGGFNPKTEPKGADEPSQDAVDVVKELNQTCAIVTIGSKLRILVERFNPDPFQDNFKLMTYNDFRGMMKSQVIHIADKNGNPKAVEKAEIWYGDPNRRELINGLTFRPDQPREVDGCFNVWEGWRYKEVEGDWSLFKAHIKKVCNDDEANFEWLLDWMADAVQDPMNPKGCAVVMKGIEGAGKGTIANVFGELFGMHFKHIIQEEQLIGKFNGHLEEALLVFADEVTYGGNKKVAGTLKGLVTEKKLMIERKGLDAVPYRNCLRLMVASNESWFIPAGPQSRRWFVLDVPSDVASDKAYFDALHGQMNNGGYEAMMHELRRRVITNDLGKAPETSMLKTQRALMAMSESAVKAFWVNLVESGDWGVVSHNGKVIRREVFDLARSWASERNGQFNKRFPQSENLFWGETSDIIDDSFFKVNGRKPRVGNKAAMPIPDIAALSRCLAKNLGLDNPEHASDWGFLNTGLGNENAEM